MAETISVAPPNALVLVCDQTGGEIPLTMGGTSIAATSSCVAIGCLAEDDGETEVTLGFLSEFIRLGPPVFETRLQTPGRRVVVRSVYGEDLLALSVANEVISLRIWTNDLTEPDRIVVGVA